MSMFYEMIGEGMKHLSPLQMGIRAFLIFLVTLLLIRLSGRRSFGMHSPFDNVISILLGAVLSRSVFDGNSPFFSPIVAATVIALFHRLFAWVSMHSDTFGMLVKGSARILYKDGTFFEKNMRRSFITKKDLMEGIRKEGQINSLEKVKSACLERDGNISVIKKEENTHIG